MPGVKELRRLSQEGAPADVGAELPPSEAGPLVMVAPSGEQYTDDGGRVLGLGWAEYYDPSSGSNFYVHDFKGLTEWTYPEELLPASAVAELASGGGGGSLFPSIGPTQSGGKSARRENSLATGKPPGPLALFNSQSSVFGDDEDTEGSSDEEDDGGRAARLGGGFRTSKPPYIEEGPEEEVEAKKPLNAATQAMLDKLNGTRAGQSGALMENQAAFKKDGMLMLESIANKDDPTVEKADDEETILRLQSERVKMQEEMEKVRSCFSEVELFRLREEFNEVDADRSGYIDDEELKVLLTILNDSKVPSESEVRRIMLSADASGDGQLDFLEFLSLVKALRDEKKMTNSLAKRLGKLVDTVKQDVLGSVMADVKE
jgi:Ca2+-binding EF-hand superfamily protein